MYQDLLVGPLVCALVIWTYYVAAAWWSDHRTLAEIAENRVRRAAASDLAEIVALDQRFHAINHSKLKKLMIDSRDSVLRGAILGALSGGLSGSIKTGISWALAGGILAGITDPAGWTPRFVG